MAHTDAWAQLLAPEAPWLESTRTLLGPIKSAIVHSHPTVTYFFRHLDVTANNLLSFYAPDLPAGARQNGGLPMMDVKDVAIVLIGYLLVVGLSLLLMKDSTTSQTAQIKMREEKAVFAKMGPVFIFQAIYNVAQVTICGFMVLRALDVVRTEEYSLLCNRFNVPNTRMAEVTWVFYMLKYLDLLDTAFMILRGNWRQVSFLHVYHHSSVIYISWINASVGYDGEIYYVVALNSFVHVVMYTYYLLASLNAPLARMVKFFVTKLQMAQFLSMTAHASYHIYSHNTCHYPVRVTIGYLLYVASLFILFRNFSKKTYRSEDNKEVKVKAA